MKEPQTVTKSLAQSDSQIKIQGICGSFILNLVNLPQHLSLHPYVAQSFTPSLFTIFYILPWFPKAGVLTRLR